MSADFQPFLDLGRRLAPCRGQRKTARLITDFDSVLLVLSSCSEMHMFSARVCFLKLHCTLPFGVVSGPSFASISAFLAHAPSLTLHPPNWNPWPAHTHSWPAHCSKANGAARRSGDRGGTMAEDIPQVDLQYEKITMKTNRWSSPAFEPSTDLPSINSHMSIRKNESQNASDGHFQMCVPKAREKQETLGV